MFIFVSSQKLIIEWLSVEVVLVLCADFNGQLYGGREVQSCPPELFLTSSQSSWPPLDTFLSALYTCLPPLVVSYPLSAIVDLHSSFLTFSQRLLTRPDVSHLLSPCLTSSRCFLPPHGVSYPRSVFLTASRRFLPPLGVSYLLSVFLTFSRSAVKLVALSLFNIE